MCHRRKVETPPPPPVLEPVEVGEITEEELQQYDGSDPEKPPLMAIKGQIYDVSQGRYRSLRFAVKFCILFLLLPAVKSFRLRLWMSDDH
jgi:hypothetical protein